MEGRDYGVEREVLSKDWRLILGADGRTLIAPQRIQQFERRSQQRAKGGRDERSTANLGTL